MYVTNCLNCGKTVVYANFEESLNYENCPHCERLARLNAKKNRLEDMKKFIEAKKICTNTPIFLMEEI